jgi:hypothetical protein
MPSIADIYSYIDSLKRRGSDFIQNPGTSLQQMVGYANDRAGAYNQALSESAREPLTGPKTQALASQMAEGYFPVGMTVYHGSPYKFTAFDPAKIGTGEGAQAYGHGLYVAENPTVAKGYAKNVKDLDSIQSYNQRLKQISKIMDEDSVYPGAYRKFKSDKGKKAAEEYDAVMEMRDQKSTDPGNLYKIDLPDEHIEKMLDWDKPLSQQPKNVQKAFNSIIKDSSILDEDTLKGLKSNPDPIGKSFYNQLSMSDNISHPSEASNILNKLDVPGIKYLDEQSRGAEEGTRNFVIFPGNEHLLDIQDINGNPIK